MPTASFSTVHCVVFDIDDTLYLERDYVKSGFEALAPLVRERFGAIGFADRAFAAFERGIRGTTFDVALAECGVAASPHEIAELVAAYRAHRPKIALATDAARCLADLHGRLPVAVVSDGPLVAQQNKTAALGLAEWCDPILLTEALGAGLGKPHPAAFEMVERAAGTRGEQCLYVADNPAKDFQAPRALGWRTLRIRRPLSLHYATAEPLFWDAELANLDKLAELLNLGKRGV
ncbi:MAG: HAD family hydrolase [Planctomycetota bacterium]|nr:MAG: HAD family hydrolase [Planctomycetota bacterium]